MSTFLENYTGEDLTGFLHRKTDAATFTVAEIRPNRLPSSTCKF